MNNSTNATGMAPLFPFQRETVVVTFVLYPAIFILSAVGNIMVCLVVFHRYRSKTLRNYYVLILNLAISDLAAAAIAQFDVPIVAEGMVWIYGEVMCKVLQALHNITYYTSVWTLAGISLVRYRGIIYPLGRQVSNKQAMLICFGIWVSVTLIRLPSIITREYFPQTKQCHSVWKSVEQFQANEVSMAVLLFFIPFFITVAAYCRIGYAVGTRVRMASKSDAKQAQETRKIIRMLVIATTFFFMCVIPVQLVYLLGTFNRIEQFDYFWDFSVFVQILALMHTATNPICYTLSNDQFRKEIYASCCCVDKNSILSGRSTMFSKGSNGQTLRTHASVTTVEFIGSEMDDKAAVKNGNINKGCKSQALQPFDATPTVESMALKQDGKAILQNGNVNNGSNGSTLLSQAGSLAVEYLGPEPDGKASIKNGNINKGNNGSSLLTHAGSPTVEYMGSELHGEANSKDCETCF